MHLTKVIFLDEKGELTVIKPWPDAMISLVCSL